MSLIVLYSLHSTSVLSFYIDVVLTLSILVEGGSSMSRIQNNIWSQTCSIGFMSGLRAGQSKTSTSCWSRKAVVSCAVWGGALSWTYTKLHPNTPVAHGNISFFRIWMYRCRFMVPSTTTSSLLPHGGLYPYQDWRATISIIRLGTDINLPLPTAHPDPTVTVVWGEPGLITEDTVAPLSEVPHPVPPPPLTAASPVLQREPRTSRWTPTPISGRQKPSPNGSNWHPHPNSVDHLHS